MENCNKCNEVKIVGCGCQKPANCGCGTKVDLKCTVYKGVTLDPLHIVEGMNGEEIIEIVNDYLKNLIFELEPEPTILQNVGDGFEMYKGFSQSRRHEIKTLAEGDGILITEFENELSIRVDPDFINGNAKTITNIGLGEKLFKGLSGTENEFKTVIGTDGILIESAENNLVFKVDANWIKGLFTSGAIDICELIDRCNNPPVIVGDIVYELANRTVNLPLVESDFTSRYYDREGDEYMFIKITGGELRGLVKRNLQPLMIDDIIAVEDIKYIKYSGPDTDSVNTQIVNYVAINSRGQQSN